MIEKKILQLKNTYDIDSLRLKFTQANILLDENKEDEFLDKIYDSLVISIHLELEIKVIFL